MMEGIKDAVSVNIATAVRTHQVDMKPEQLAKMLAIVSASIEEGYHRSSRVFDRVVTDVVKQVAAPVPPVAATGAKKKTP